MYIVVFITIVTVANSYINRILVEELRTMSS